MQNGFDFDSPMIRLSTGSLDDIALGASGNQGPTFFLELAMLQ
jgi:hypothetical protein